MDRMSAMRNSPGRHQPLLSDKPYDPILWMASLPSLASVVPVPVLAEPGKQRNKMFVMMVFVRTLKNRKE
jgi:hypothetical protein